MPENGQKRRTQKDRSESTQKTLLEATLRCIGRDGYAAISLAEIAKEAGVSRGAITHHYGSKLDLAAAAMRYFFEDRYERLLAQLTGENGNALTLEERIDILARELGALFPIGFEITVAIRTDPALNRRYKEVATYRFDEMTAGYERMFPEFSGAASPQMHVSVIASFLRGMFIEGFSSDQARLDEMLTIFKAMLRAYVETTQLPRK